MTLSHSYKSLPLALTLAAVDTHYTRRLYAGKVCRFNTLSAQPRDIDSCCPTPWVARRLKPKLKWNPLRLSFPHAARWLLDASTSDIHWQLMQQLAPRGAVLVRVPVPVPALVPVPVPCACLSPCPFVWLRASAGPESMAQFWLAAVLAVCS